MKKHRLRRNLLAVSGQRKDHKGQSTYINISIGTIFAGSRSFLRSLLSFVSPQVCTPSCLGGGGVGPSCFFLFVSFPSFIGPRTQLRPLAMKLEIVFLRIQRLLRCLENSDPKNSSEFSRINRSIEDP